MNGADRLEFFGRHAVGLSALLLIFVILTVVRSIRDDFAVEIWADLGLSEQPAIFAKSEAAVMLGVVAINGAAILIRSNRRAFIGSLGLILAGFGLVLVSLWGQSAGQLSPFAFMVLVGLGMYVPYVAFHTTVFERLIAAFRERGNIGYLMYLADAVGYFGYVAVMVSKNYLPEGVDHLGLFMAVTLWTAIAAIGITVVLVVYYARTVPDDAVEESGEPA